MSGLRHKILFPYPYFILFFLNFSLLSIDTTSWLPSQICAWAPNFIIIIINLRAPRYHFFTSGIIFFTSPVSGPGSGGVTFASLFLLTLMLRLCLFRALLWPFSCFWIDRRSFLLDGLEVPKGRPWVQLTRMCSASLSSSSWGSSSWYLLCHWMEVQW